MRQPPNDQPFADLNALASDLRGQLVNKNYILIYAFNGTGKTRLSTAFKNLGKQGNLQDTLYFNAFTEDLFTWDNDLDGDSNRALKINSDSRFFEGLKELAIEDRINGYLHRYADFDYAIDYDDWKISFSREVQTASGSKLFENIKVSRGEQNTFIWCFFLAIVQLALDNDDAYKWVKYVYIDDPISSLDDDRVIAVATDMVGLIKDGRGDKKIVISSHHTLFFNIVYNSLKREKGVCPYFLRYDKDAGDYHIIDTQDTPSFLHIAMLKELRLVAESGVLYTYHFNMLRAVLEKTASFHGLKMLGHCLTKDEADLDTPVYIRMVNLLSHGNYSLYEPREMLEDNKQYFKKILGACRTNTWSVSVCWVSLLPNDGLIGLTKKFLAACAYDVRFLLLVNAHLTLHVRLERTPRERALVCYV